MSDNRVTRGSGSVYRDLGLPDAVEMEVKSVLVMAIHDLLVIGGLTSDQFADLVEVNRIEMKGILRGRFSAMKSQDIINWISVLSMNVER